MNVELVFPTVLVGKTKQEAIDICQKKGYSTRIVSEDEKGFVLTMDFKTNRVDLRIEKNIVVKASIG